MRETKAAPNGSVVASVVAVLEKQSSSGARPRPAASAPRRAVVTSVVVSSADGNSESKGIVHRNEADHDFRNAVQVFNSVAEDVRKVFEQTGPLNRTGVAADDNSPYGKYRIQKASSLKTLKETAPSLSDYFSPNTKSLERSKVRTVLQRQAWDLAESEDQQLLQCQMSRMTSYSNPQHQYYRKTSPSSAGANFGGSKLTDICYSKLEDENNSGHDEGNAFGHLENRKIRSERSSSDEGSSSGASSGDSGSESERELNNSGLATIEEERATSAHSSHRDLDENESTQEDESTLKASQFEWNEGSSTQGSTSDVSTSSSECNRGPRDSSTRCNADFQWINNKEDPETMRNHLKPLVDTPNLESHPLSPSSSSKPPLNKSSLRDRPLRQNKATGSLDRRRTYQTRHDRDQKSKSTHVKSPPRSSDEYHATCQNCCCTSVPPTCCGDGNVVFDNFHRRHERYDPQKYGSSPQLIERRNGSHPDLYSEVGRYRHDLNCGACNYHIMSPPAPVCCFYGERNFRWTPPPVSKPSEHDEKFRKLLYEKDNLQLQVQVLSEQIEAQGDKIAELEKHLQEKKHVISEAEDKLQREILSRSSLETQKLELMSIISDLKLQHAAIEKENMELRGACNNNELKKSLVLSRSSPQPQLTSTPLHSGNNQAISLRTSPSPSPVTSRLSDPTGNLPENQPPKTPPSNYKRQIDIHYGSLPRQQFLSNGGTLSNVDLNANPASVNGRKGVAFAQAEKVVIDSNDPLQQQTNKNKSIKKIFGKIRRSGSGNLEDLPGASDFQRGGIRATASARLGWSEPHLTQKPDKPFAEWDTENICDWLQDLGLDQYVTEAKRWIKTGQQLQETPMNEVEKELNIKNPLHRKKLQLALIDAEVNGSSDPYLKKAGELDTAWVLRWLDDTGLPQHKENFLINRVDGRVLHRLTIDDLALLHVTSMLHVASIKRGIQVLRENNYDPSCLQRRSLPDEPSHPTTQQVTLWTTHRVMEWLKAVDLAEYAPNLRGAGVHGGLMVYETKFTAELLASLLSIPPGKTLLRRHLSTHFKELLGKDTIQKKREAEATLGYIPLTPSLKLKMPKKSQFSLKRKKSKGEADYGDLVCPLSPEKSSGEINGSAFNNSMGTMKMPSLKEEDVYHLAEASTRSLPTSVTNSPISFRGSKV